MATGSFLVRFAVVALGLFARVDAATYSVSASTLYMVPEDQRRSPQDFAARDYTIIPPDSLLPLSHISFDVDTPVNVFVSYASNATAGNKTFGSIKVSGTSSSAVDYIVVESDSFFRDTIKIHTDYDVAKRLDADDAVLIEIQLHQKNVLKDFSLSGTGTAVLSDNVVYTSTTNETGLLHILGAKLFVVDPTATLTTDIQVYDLSQSSFVQVEAVGFNNRAGLNVTCGGQSHDVRLFVDGLRNVSLLLDDGSQDSTLCVTSKTPIDVTQNRVKDITLSTEGTKAPPVARRIPAGSLCTKQSPPKREPVVIKDPTLALLSPATTAPVRKTSPNTGSMNHTTTPVPTSAASHQSSEPLLCMAAALAIGLAVHA